MKKKILVLGLIGILLFSSCSSSISGAEQNQESKTVSKEENENSEVENPDFRNCKWGMSKEEVKKYETDIDITEENEEKIKAIVEVDNTDFLAEYYFNNDKLEQVTMLSMEEHSNENLFIDDYTNFQELISKKYGEPNQDKKIWSNDLYKDNSEDWGFAISLGDLAMISQWFTDTTEIGLTLSGDNYEIIFGIIYRDINYEKEDDISGI